jgi:methylamine dehydrogenase light chain
MIRLTERVLGLFDTYAEGGARLMARRTGRRSVLSWLGTAALGGAKLPVLPFDRAGSGTARAQAEKTDTECEYWRYCALDGFLCTCCGGSVSQCPPSASVSNVTWVGTCQNPGDGKQYLISYNDCCGVASCGRCLCNFNVRERPGYRMAVHNDINWCMANEATNYHCTVAAVVGLGESPG